MAFAYKSRWRRSGRGKFGDMSMPEEGFDGIADKEGTAPETAAAVGAADDEEEVEGGSKEGTGADDPLKPAIAGLLRAPPATAAAPDDDVDAETAATRVVAASGRRTPAVGTAKPDVGSV